MQTWVNQYDPNHRVKKTMNFLYESARMFVRLYSRVMLNLDVHWHGHLPPGPKIFVANHPSATDPFILHLLSREPMSVLIVSTAFAVPLFGEYIRRSGQIQVLQGKGRQALELARRYLDKGYSVGIFPEGNFSPQTGGFREPRGGAARLALRTGAPVIPVGIYLPRQGILRIKSRLCGRPTVGYWYLRGPYGITVGNPIALAGNPEDPAHVRTSSQKLMDWIKSLAQESEFRMRRLAPAPVRY
jgi:1-acyl-sn-glycerol-3-phosphate acyltransferase